MSRAMRIPSLVETPKVALPLESEILLTGIV
nr:MAG TPA: hypothetical protein [Caudoviricetes sp.]